MSPSTTTPLPTNQAVDLDLWAGALNRPPAVVLNHLTARPDIWHELPILAHRRITCGEAVRLEIAEPGGDPFNFGGRLFERLRERAAGAPPEEQAQLHDLVKVLTFHSSSLQNLCLVLRRRGHVLLALRELHRDLGTFLESVAATEPSDRSPA